ncbi:hypothetical protein PR048_016922 [Dryococelus australis]|uniref:Peptidase M12B domain-containing protein n=1 Tax=Dryococelus australis TaxID=614101 RepID=A0ABQ9H851_9NEOP|nr:hypothetical protein PR048_016922 [Dryococelus australis]
MNKVMKAVEMIILHKAEEYTTLSRTAYNTFNSTLRHATTLPHWACATREFLVKVHVGRVSGISRELVFEKCSAQTMNSIHSVRHEQQAVQALYHHPSVGQPIDITLVKMELLRSQPPDLPHFGGERGPLLDSFCDYNMKHNPAGDANPRHWDMGLYISGDEVHLEPPKLAVPNLDPRSAAIVDKYHSIPDRGNVGATGSKSIFAVSSHFLKQTFKNKSGATVAKRLACSPPTEEIRIQSPAGSLRIFACGNCAGRCRWSAGFLGDLPFPPVLSFRRCSLLTAITLIGFQHLDVKSLTQTYNAKRLLFHIGLKFTLLEYLEALWPKWQIYGCESFESPYENVFALRFTIARRIRPSVRPSVSQPSALQLVSVRPSSVHCCKLIEAKLFTNREMKFSTKVNIFGGIVFGAAVGAAVRLLACHLGEPGSIPGFSHLGIVPDDAANRWVFSGISHFPRPFIPVQDMLRAAQISSLSFLFTTFPSVKFEARRNIIGPMLSESLLFHADVMRHLACQGMLPFLPSRFFAVLVNMRLATVGGVCMEKYACVIAELGTTNVFGKPYPSAGFTSVYILAHEMGHNLGMHHDGSQNTCPKDGFIMSPSRGTSGETQWSSCSAEVMKKLRRAQRPVEIAHARVYSSSWATCLNDAPATPTADMDQSRYLDEPGQHWGAKRQCELLLRDRDAALLYPDKMQVTSALVLQLIIPLTSLRLFFRHVWHLQLHFLFLPPWILATTLLPVRPSYRADTAPSFSRQSPPRLPSSIGVTTVKQLISSAATNTRVGAPALLGWVPPALRGYVCVDCSRSIYTVVPSLRRGTPTLEWGDVCIGGDAKCNAGRKVALRENPRAVSIDICENLKCKTPHRSGYYFAGPALEGTSCGPGKWCHGGECVIMKKKKPVHVVKGGWSDWKQGKCSSGCIIKSRGNGLDSKRKGNGLDSKRKGNGLDSKRKGNGLDSKRKGNGLDSKRKGNGLDSKRKGNGLDSKRKGNGLDSKRKGNGLDSKWKGNGLDSKRKGNGLDSKRKGNGLDSKRKGNGLDSKRKGNGLDSKRKGNGLDSKRKGNGLDSKRKGNGLDSKRKGNGLDSKRKGNGLDSKRKGNGLDSKRKGNGLDSKRKGNGLDSKRKGNGLDSKRKGNGLDSKRKGNGLDSKRKGNGLDSKRKGNGLDSKHIESARGIETDPEKTKSIRHWPTLTDKTEVRSFLGLCTYYRRFVPRFATIVKPLHELTETKRMFHLTTECENAFNSRWDGRPLGYVSKLFHKPEINYFVTRRELLAMVEAISDFHPYLYGRHFILRTDNASLSWPLNFKNPEGEISNADALSKMPCEPFCRRCEHQLEKSGELLKPDVAQEHKIKIFANKRRAAMCCFDQLIEHCAGTVVRARSFQTRKRTCDNPKPVNTEEGCEGPSFDVLLCKDDKGSLYRKLPLHTSTLHCAEVLRGTLVFTRNNFRKFPSLTHEPTKRSLLHATAVVTEQLVRSPPTKSNWVQSPARSLLDFRKWYSCHKMLLVGGFYPGSPFHPPFFFIPELLHSHIDSPSSTLKTSLLGEPLKSLHSLYPQQKIAWFICKKGKRRTATDYATKACAQFSKLLPELDSKPSGLQAPHEEGKLSVRLLA